MNNNHRWKNMLYFLNYCDNAINELEDSIVDFEEINGLYDILATLLNVYFEDLYARGYLKNYERQDVLTDRPRGKMNIAKSYNTGVIYRNKVYCKVTNITIDNKYTRIIKAALVSLLQMKSIIKQNILNKVICNIQILYNVQDIVVDKISLLNMSYDINIPQHYMKAINISKFILNQWMLIDTNGMQDLVSVQKDRECYIWEKFLHNYIKEYINRLNIGLTVTKEQYTLGIEESTKERITRQPDISIYGRKDDFMLLLDAKWYENPKMNIFYNQLCAHGKIMDLRPNKGTRVGVVCGHNRADKKKINEIGGKHNKTYGIYMFIINIEQDFELVKLDIQNMINELLEIEKTT